MPRRGRPSSGASSTTAAELKAKVYDIVAAAGGARLTIKEVHRQAGSGSEQIVGRHLRMWFLENQMCRTYAYKTIRGRAVGCFYYWLSPDKLPAG